MESNHNDFLDKLRSIDSEEIKREHYGHPLWKMFPPSLLEQATFRDRSGEEEEVFRQAVCGENDSHTVKTPGHRLLDRVERLERKIDHIFGDHVLIRGQWVPKSKLIIEDDEQG